MRTIGIALLVASLATAANAASPDQEKCRALATGYQQIADEAHRFRQAIAASIDRGSERDLSLPAIDGDVLAQAGAHRVLLYDALAAYRDALDALAHEYRACKPKD